MSDCGCRSHTDWYGTKIKHCALHAAAEQMAEALEFYAHGEWSFGYPGGVKIRQGLDAAYLDFGDRARKALAAASARRGGELEAAP